MPPDCDRADFLAHMGWTDFDTYHSQPLWWYQHHWRIYEFQSEYGLLRQGLF